MDDLVDGEGRTGRFRVRCIIGRERFGNAGMSQTSSRACGAGVQRRKAAHNAGCALRDDEIRIRDDEQRGADDGEAQACSRRWMAGTTWTSGISKEARPGALPLDPAKDKSLEPDS